ncbi:MipA/OmpV family protein [Bdellovibrio sp. HCB2-146]|uniref:MipA/OmpV family protein n=1 Tax=Bdellovibrio sp. HCB2-146 TaxID=3394362 RepID=UPI0039BD88DB
MRFYIYLVACILLSSTLSFAQESEEETESPAYWDYGIGLGAVYYEQYPASNQFSFLAVPAPTFQYRGKIVRADDKDGAHIYLYKGTAFSIELAGAGYPALDSSNNAAREGMEDLPWLIALGPEIVSRTIEHFEFGLGAYQALTTDFDMTRTSGAIFEGRVTYHFDYPFAAYGPFQEPGASTGRLTFSMKGGSEEFQNLYFEVSDKDATTERPAFDARDGFLSYNISYFQNFKSGRFSVNLGAMLSSYDLSANRASPLHKSDHNLTGLIGLNYILGGSSKPEVPENQTSGVINSLRKNRQLREGN